jgi:hypothetical protein
MVVCSVQEVCSFADSSLSLSAIRPSSGSNWAFSFRIGSIRRNLYRGPDNAGMASNLLANATPSDVNHDFVLPSAQPRIRSLRSAKAFSFSRRIRSPLSFAMQFYVKPSSARKPTRM